ncbi:GDYXXLXY domain-containing protein, partial [Delftia sp. ZNC0008]
RSLMQGDYMRLNFRLPSEDRDVEKENLRSGRLYAIGKLDEQGVVQWLRTGTASEPLAPGEQRFELTPRGGRWTLVTDAWYFREGDGQRWEQARYGEFRVEPDGRALLVGMADAQLRPIVP